MSSFRVQEGEDDDAIPAARPSSMKKRTTASARNSINMSWSLRSGASTDELRSSNSPGPVAFSTTQSVPSSQTTFAEPAVVPRKAKGVSFFVQDDSDQDDNEPEEDPEPSPAVEGDEEVMRSMPENVRMGFENLGIDDTPDQEQDPVARYYDNDGQDDEQVQETQEIRDTDEGADNRKDQERLDRFMQPTSNIDEGVLELNRERIDWQSMLQSVLAGDVFNTEQRRLKEPQYAIQPAVKQQIWLGIRSILRNRPVGDEKRFVEEARNQADGFLQEVLTFKSDPSSSQSSLEQVVDVLRKVDIVESMYPTLAAVDKPVYKSPKFHKCLEALNAYASIMKKMKIQIKILRNWTGSETLEVTRYKDAAGNEVSFVDRLLKEDGLQRAFEKSTLGALHQAMTQIRETMIENAVNFARMGLVPTMSDIQLLIRFPTTLMQECLRLRLEYANRVTVPTLLIVDQMVGDFKTSLELACKIMNEYRILEKSEDGWYLESCIGEEFEKVLKSSLRFYFKLLSWKVEYEGQNKIYSSSVLEDEWDNLSKLGQQIDGIGLDTAEQLCFLISKSTAFVYKHLQDQIKDSPEQPQPAEITRFYGKILEDVRSRANKLRQFSRKLTDTFENATEYLLDKKKGDSLANMMIALAETNHVLIYTNAIENQGIYMIVEYKVAERPNSLPDTLRSCFEQQGTGYILIFTPRERFVWSGAILHVEGFNDIEIDIKPGRVRLISERGSNLDACKKRFDKVSEPFGLEIITESRANVPALNKELNKAKKASYKLTDTIVQSVTVLRKATSKVPNCQDLVQPFFRFASDYGIKSLSTMEGLPRSQFNLKLLRLSIDWVSFVCDDCDQSERKTFRWAMTALTFAMNMTKGNNILALSDSEFSWLRSKIAGCMTLLISHFDIHGARSQSEAMRAERDGRSKDPSGRMEEISNIFQLAMAHEKSLSPEAKQSHQLQLENLAKLDNIRVEKERESGIVGKVLDDEKPEDRSLVFLAGLTDSKAIRYQMAKYVGSGTFGTVYLATNLVTGELMAVKEIRFQNASMSLFKSIRDEMKVMKMMHHPNIVQYDSIEVHRHKVLMFMEYCQGGSLADLLEHGRIEDEKVIKVYTYQMLRGLAYLHGKNVVHRDVKPDNVLLDHFGNIKFVDFGAAKILAKNQRTRTKGRATESVAVGAGANSLNGTPMYMAPEVIKNGERGRKGSMDIWSLGCCVLEMATGRRPWAHLDNEWAVMYHVATSHPPLPEPSQMTPRGMAFLKKCFVRDSNERPSATELLRDPWLRGVENEETRQLYEDFDENEVGILGEIVRSDSDLNGQPNADDNATGDYDEDEIEGKEEKLDAHEDYGGDESPGVVIPLFSHDEEKEPVEASQAADHGVTDFGTTEELEDMDRDGQMSPSNESVVSEVGSEVEMMLSALRERQEGSKQPSKRSSPMPAALPISYGYAGDGGLEIMGGESGYPGIPSLVAAVASAADTATGTTVPGLTTTSSMDPARFGREMGLELYNSMSPELREPRSQMSPVLAVKLMERPMLPIEQEMLAVGQGLPQEREVSEQELSRIDRSLEKSLESNGDGTA